MGERDRATLKALFREGALPTAVDFGDLIDSTVNRVEDGFDKDEEKGLRLTSEGTSRSLLSFYRGLEADEEAWRVEHGVEKGTLLFQAGGGAESYDIGSGAARAPGSPGLALTRAGRVGVNVEKPEWQLDVGGVARMEGRIGKPWSKAESVPADGGWKDITETLTGCQAFEVVAGVGGTRGKGRYSMLHAIALNPYHPGNRLRNWLFRRRSIKAQTAVYGSYADRLQLRWKSEPGLHNYRLQLRTNAGFGDGFVVRYYLTKLWFDPEMDESRPSPAGGARPAAGHDT